MENVPLRELQKYFNSFPFPFFLQNKQFSSGSFSILFSAFLRPAIFNNHGRTVKLARNVQSQGKAPWGRGCVRNMQQSASLAKRPQWRGGVGRETELL